MCVNNVNKLFLKYVSSKYLTGNKVIFLIFIGEGYNIEDTTLPMENIFVAKLLAGLPPIIHLKIPRLFPDCSPKFSIPSERLKKKYFYSLLSQC